MTKETLFVSFSGGRTSAYMCWWLLENKADEYDFIFVFANTGLEHEKTLEFVDRCDKEFGLNVVWVEAYVHAKRIGTGHTIVDFQSASRGGEPMEAVIKKYGIPNQDYPHCTRETKLAPMRDYKRELNFNTYHPMAIGIRSDEPRRLPNAATAEMLGLVYPLAHWTQCTEPQIRHWWADQDFDLDLPVHYGNCVTCWKKSNRKLLTIARHDPHYFDFMDRMEQIYPDAGAGDQKRVFFRGYKTADDFLMECKEPFKEFVDVMPEYQLNLLSTDEKVAVLIDMNEMDIEEDCGAGGCEIS